MLLSLFLIAKKKQMIQNYIFFKSNILSFFFFFLQKCFLYSTYCSSICCVHSAILAALWYFLVWKCHSLFNCPLIDRRVSYFPKIAIYKSLKMCIFLSLHCLSNIYLLPIYQGIYVLFFFKIHFLKWNCV